MASLQGGQKVVLVQNVAPIDLQYNNQGAAGGANWDLPSPDHPTADLISAFTIDVTGNVPGLNEGTRLALLGVSFQLSLTEKSYGWDKSNVQYGYKLTEEGAYEYASAQGGIKELTTGRGPAWVEIVFVVDKQQMQGPIGNNKKVYFQLKDDTAEDPKSGLIIHQARIKQTGFNN